MAIFKVFRPNNIFPSGWVEEIEPGVAQQCTMHNEEGKWIPMYNYGPIVPLHTVREFLIRIQKAGVDKEALRG